MIKEIEENGCYFGHLSEINPSLLNKLEKLNPLLNREFYTRVTHSYFGNSSDKIESTTVSTFKEAEIIKNDWLKRKYKDRVWQIFYTFNNENNEGSKILSDLIPDIRELFSEIITYCYGEETLDRIWEINRNLINVTNFTKDCYIDNHADGGNPNMVCNILIYLNKDWVDGDGCELVIGNKFKQQPKWGNFAVLDFVKHNPSHSVTPYLSENNNRFAVLTGVLTKENNFIYNS
jgi:Rps23 Pro-64 3,4-dihydroxylase Tpa1-like proline 4-hydroxylase